MAIVVVVSHPVSEWRGGFFFFFFLLLSFFFPTFPKGSLRRRSSPLHSGELSLAVNDPVEGFVPGLLTGGERKGRDVENARTVLIVVVPIPKRSYEFICFMYNEHDAFFASSFFLCFFFFLVGLTEYCPHLRTLRPFEERATRTRGPRSRSECFLRCCGLVLSPFREQDEVCCGSVLS